MDVHYLPPLHRQSKPAKEYFIQFIFIFLAVTLGFFANHDRESFLEKEKANEYAKSLLNDLKVDTAFIKSTFNEKVWIEEKFDSVEKILATKNLEEYNEYIYYVERYISNPTIFISQDITFKQLSNNSSFQYIKDINLYKKIAYYYNLYNQYKTIENTYSSTVKEDLTGIESKLFNPRDLTSQDNAKARNFYSLALLSEIKLKPIKRDYDTLKLFYIKVDNAKKHANITIVILGRLRVYAADIMKDINKNSTL